MNLQEFTKLSQRVTDLEQKLEDLSQRLEFLIREHQTNTLATSQPKKASKSRRRASSKSAQDTNEENS